MYQRVAIRSGRVQDNQLRQKGKRSTYSFLGNGFKIFLCLINRQKKHSKVHLRIDTKCLRELVYLRKRECYLQLCRSFCLEHQLVGACNCTLSLLYHHYHPRVSFCQLLLNKDTQCQYTYIFNILNYPLLPLPQIPRHSLLLPTATQQTHPIIVYIYI